MAKHNTIRLSESKLRQLVKECTAHTVRIMEAQSPERDMTTGGDGSYSADTPKNLYCLFNHPKYEIAGGEFVDLVYVQASAMNRTYNNKGYIGRDGQYTSFDEIEKTGRAFNKKYLNDIFDSEKYQKRKFKREFGVFQVNHLKLNWAAMTYPKYKQDVRDAIYNADEDTMREYMQMSPDFQKRFAKYCQENPELADELEVMLQDGTLDRDTIMKIHNTKLKDASSGWTTVNKYMRKRFDKEEGRDREALRMTQTTKQTEMGDSTYYVVNDGVISQITRDEYFQLWRMFGTNKKDTTKTHTKLGDILDELSARHQVRDRYLDKIVSLSCQLKETATGRKKPFKYENNQIIIPGLSHPLTAHELTHAPMAESRENRKRGTKSSLRLTESDLHRVIKESVRKVLKESMRFDNKSLRNFMQTYYDNDSTCIDALRELQDEAFIHSMGWKRVWHEGNGQGVYSPKEGIVATFDEDDLPTYHSVNFFRYNPNAWVSIENDGWDDVYGGNNGSDFEVEPI